MLTPEQLGITAKELASLLMVRELLASGIAKHERYLNEAELWPDLDRDKPRQRIPLFDMGEAATKRHCGTTCCIGGWMYVFQQDVVEKDERGFYLFDYDSARQYVGGSKSRNLHHLFYPMDDNAGEFIQGYDVHDFSYTQITEPMAVQAIDNFVATGDANWPDVLLKHNIITHEEM